MDRSPFYPEGGGQIGDAGTVETGDGSFRFEVRDTRKLGDVVVHLGEAQGSPSDGATVQARVDAGRRDRTRKNHTATHLLHLALRQVLGDHVNQQGSYVGPDRLRFDFSHPKGMSDDEVDRVEQEVNARVYANPTLETTVEDLEAAKARGVMALFGEKYDQRVRVVAVGDSVELCGGTHVRAAGDIGPFVIASESAIQAGVRRIEALTGPAAVEHLQRQRRLLTTSAQSLRTAPDELPDRIAQLQDQVKAAKKQQKAGAQADVSAALGEVKDRLAEADGYRTAILDLPQLDAGALRELGTGVKSLSPDLAVALFGRQGGKVPFLILCQGAALERGLAAGALAKAVSKHLGGGGGGKPESAQGQGQDPAGVEAAMAALAEALSGGA